MTVEKGYTQADYEAFLRIAKANSWWSVYNAAAEDGYDPTVNWSKLSGPETPDA